MIDELRKIVIKTHEYFIGSYKTLSVAESCTGGFISSLLTDIEGASRFFKGGIVCYWSEAKIDVLGVTPETLTMYGAISEETATEMAEKVRLLFNSDYSLAITGNLGATTIEGKEKGLVYVAISKKGVVKLQKLSLSGDRIENKKVAALSALKFLISIK
ncbi:MAG: CinA family protein [Thermodesulfovibrionales bacterium]|nr:CinA family protein [Thermodesulfovibrionales bacterium]